MDRFYGCLTTFFNCVVKVSNGRMTVSDELEMMWKEAFVFCSKVLEETEKNKEKLQTGQPAYGRGF